LTQTSPECCIQQNDVHGPLDEALGQLLKVYDHLVGGGGNTNTFADAPHTFESPAGILKIVVSQWLDRLGDTDGFFNRPDTVRIQSQRGLGESMAQGMHGLNIVVRWIDPAFELKRCKAMSGLQRSGMCLII